MICILVSYEREGDVMGLLLLICYVGRAAVWDGRVGRHLFDDSLDEEQGRCRIEETTNICPILLLGINFRFIIILRERNGVKYNQVQSANMR